MDNIKVLHLFNEYLPETENWAYNLISALPDCEIHIGAQSYLRNNFYDSNFEFINNPLNSITKKDDLIDQSIWYRALRKFLISITPAAFRLSKKRIKQYISHQQISLIHAHFANIGCDHIPLIKELEIPFFVSFYGWDYERLPFTKPIFKKRYQKLFKTADRIICEGEHGKKTLIKMGCPTSKLVVNRLGVNVDQIPFRVRRKKRNHLRIVQIASFMEKKGHFYTFEAFKKALIIAPDIQLCLVGVSQENGIKDNLIKEITNNNLEKNVVIIDGVDYHKIHNFLFDYDVFIQPSCYSTLMDCEGGAPIALLDAQATGMPIISTNHCDIPEEVIHKETGILVPERTITELTDAIIIFYKMDSAEYGSYAKKARAHMEQNYQIKKNAAILKSHYENILSNKNNC